MNNKDIVKIVSISASLLLAAGGIYCYLSSGLGKLTEEDANTCFSKSNIKSEKGVTGVDFFKYLRVFIDKLDSETLNETFRKDLRGVLDKVEEIVYKDTKAGENIKRILSSGPPDSAGAMSDKSLAETFIYLVLKKPGIPPSDVLEKGRMKAFIARIGEGNSVSVNGKSIKMSAIICNAMIQVSSLAPKTRNIASREILSSDTGKEEEEVRKLENEYKQKIREIYSRPKNPLSRISDLFWGSQVEDELVKEAEEEYERGIIDIKAKYNNFETRGITELHLEMLKEPSKSEVSEEKDSESETNPPE